VKKTQNFAQHYEKMLELSRVPESVNYSGQDSHPPVVTGHLFIWTQLSGMQDLNRLIPGNSGWKLNTAADVNIWGQIIGQGTRNGQTHGYLLTPINPFQLF
jgi:hypothetical protein